MDAGGDRRELGFSHNPALQSALSDYPHVLTDDTYWSETEQQVTPRNHYEPSHPSGVGDNPDASNPACPCHSLTSMICL